MSTLNVCFGNPKHLKYQWQALVHETVKLFVPVIKASKKFKRVHVYSTMQRPKLLPQDILIYVLPNKPSGIVGSHFGVNSGGPDGHTAWGADGIGSEVYKRSWNPRMLARLAYHEAMHNKLKKGDAMHSHGGLAGSPIYEDTKDTQANIKRFAEALGKNRHQWTGGWDVAKPSEDINLNSDDPLSGL